MAQGFMDDVAVERPCLIDDSQELFGAYDLPDDGGIVQIPMHVVVGPDQIVTHVFQEADLIGVTDAVEETLNAP